MDSSAAGSERDAHDEALAEVFAQIARQLEAERDPVHVLNRITSSAVEVVPGCQHAGVLVADRHGQIRTPAASDDLPVQVDRIQYETQQGPCLAAIRHHEVYLTDELASEQRWPEFSQRAARETGVTSMLSFRLFLRLDTIGALNLYSRRRAAFDGHARAIGAVLAAHAAVAISASRQRERADNLEAALQSSREIGIAIGILMAQGAVTREEAFRVLRHASNHLNVKLRDVANTIVQMGGLPQARDVGGNE